MPDAGDAEPVAGGDRAGVAAGVAHRLRDLAGDDRAGRLGHAGGVGVEVGLGVVGQKRGEALADAPGGHDRDRLGRLAVDLLGHRDDVLVVRQDHDPIGGAGLDRGEQVGGRRVHRLAAGDHPLHAEAVEDPPDAVADGHGDHRGGRRLGGVRRLVEAGAAGDPLDDPALLLELLDLLEQVGDPDLLGAAGVDGRLDGGADVVGVDVAVPDAVAARPRRSSRRCLPTRP